MVECKGLMPHRARELLSDRLFEWILLDNVKLRRKSWELLKRIEENSAQH